MAQDAHHGLGRLVITDRPAPICVVFHLVSRRRFSTVPRLRQFSEELPPAIFLEYSVEERTPQGSMGRKATWDRLSFHSWVLRRVWLSGQERISFGDPH